MAKDRSGEVIEKFTLVRLLGQGGMGQVYIADHQFTRRRVALKVLAGQAAQSETVYARFQKEAQAAALVGHPNMVQIIDFGRDAAGLPFMAMELLNGEDLGQLLRRTGPLSVPLAAHIMCEVLDTVAAAHAGGIVHRDLKPENIFIHRRESPPWPQIKLLDFGISRFLEDEMGGGGLTKTGSILGTPYYMSFEQASGEKVDGRSDLYSIGTILYQLLTGTLPFKGNSVGAIILSIAEHQFPRPRELRPDLPVGLEAIILNAMAKDRGGRFQDAREFLAALKPFFSSYAVESLFEHPTTAPASQSPLMIQGTTSGGATGSGAHVGGIPFSPVAGGPASRGAFDEAYSGVTPAPPSLAAQPAMASTVAASVTVPQSSGTDHSSSTVQAPVRSISYRLVIGLLSVIAVTIVIGWVFLLGKKSGQNALSENKNDAAQEKKDGVEGVVRGPVNKVSSPTTEKRPAAAMSAAPEGVVETADDALSHLKRLNPVEFSREVTRVVSAAVYSRDSDSIGKLLPVMVKLCRTRRATACGAVAVIHQYHSRWDEAGKLITAATASTNTLGTWAKGFQDRYEEAKKASPGAGTGKRISAQLFGAIHSNAAGSAMQQVSPAQFKVINESCQNGNGSMCYSLAMMYAHGLAPGGKKELFQAYLALQIGCGMRHNPCCDQLCSMGYGALKAKKFLGGHLALKIQLKVHCGFKHAQCCDLYRKLFGPLSP